MSADLVSTYLIFAAAMAAAGAFAGILAGLLGVGGGIVIVPVLFQLFALLDIDSSVRMHVAVGTSLATIVLTATTSTRTHWARNSVDVALLKSWAPWIIVGAVLGMAVFGSVDSATLSTIFATAALVVAAYMLFVKDRGSTDETNLPAGPIRYALGLIIGSVSAIMGIGGGTLSVPILSLFRFPMRRAVGTAAAIGLLIAVPGTIGAVIAGLGGRDLPPLSLGYVNLLGFALLVPLTAGLAPVGARFAHKIPPQALRYAFALFLLVTAANMYASAL